VKGAWCAGDDSCPVILVREFVEYLNKLASLAIYFRETEYH
jgi:hypothetical protein